MKLPYKKLNDSRTFISFIGYSLAICCELTAVNDAAFTAYASSQYGSMNVVTDIPNYHYSRTDDGSAGWTHRNTLLANG